MFRSFRFTNVCIAGWLAFSLGCDEAANNTKPATETRSSDATRDAEPKGKLVKIGDNVHLEVAPKSRRVIVDAEVCLREGALEQFLTRKNQKEHEAILAADVDARKIHEALLLANAKPGSPVRWVPKYRAPTGTPIKVTVTYTDEKGKRRSDPARTWIKNRTTNQSLDTDWVFAGSMLLAHPRDKNAPKHYLANDGDVICVSNFEGAMLDLPRMSSKDDVDRAYDAWTERIPPIGTKVKVILEPIREKKSDD